MKHFLSIVVLALALARVSAVPWTFSWDLNPTNSMPIAGHRLMGMQGGGASVVLATAPVGDLSATVDIPAGTSWIIYAVTVAADGSESDPSNLYQVAPTPPMLAVSHTVTYDGAQRWTAHVRWTAPAASFAVTNYAGTLSRSDGTILANFSTASTNVSFPSLAAGSYVFQGWAVNAAGPGPVIMRSIPVIRPGPPRNLRR